MRTPDISVVVPVHADRGYLTSTMRSILDQTLLPVEIVVVDDGSTDGCGERAAQMSPLVRVVRTDGIGSEPARQLGVDHCTQPVIAFCDSDDLWEPNKLELQRSLIDDVAVPTVVWTGFSEFVSPELDPATIDTRPLRVNAVGMRLVSSLTVTATTFDVQTVRLGDSDSWIEWAAGLPTSVVVHHVPETLMHRRIHDTNFSRGDVEREGALLRAARARVHRQHAERP